MASSAATRSPANGGSFKVMSPKDIMSQLNVKMSESDDDEDEEEEDHSETYMVDLFVYGQVAPLIKRLQTESITEDDLQATNTDLNILSAAAMYGNHKVVELVLDKLNYKLLPDYTYTPIYYAVYNNHKRVVRILLDRINGINLAGTDEYGSTTLHIAAAYEHNEVLEMLLDRGARVDFANEHGETPLHKAAAHGNVTGVAILLRHGAFVNQLTAGGATPMHAVVSSCEEPEKARQVVDLLAMACANLDIKDNDGHSIVDVCATDELRQQIEKEAAFRANFPIHCMVRNGDEKTLREWLEHVDADALAAGVRWPGRYSQGGEWADTSFMVTVYVTPAEKEYMKYRLVGGGTDDRGPYTIRGSWDADNAIEICKMYLQQVVDYRGSFDPETRRFTGEFEAGNSCGDVEFSMPLWPCAGCRQLIPLEGARCVDCAMPNENEEITEDWVEEKRMGLEESLERIAAEINKQDEDGRTAIMCAAKEGHPKMLHILLPYCQRDELATTDNAGKTALDHALGRRLVCKRNVEKKSNDATFECIEVLCAVGGLTIDPHSIPSFMWFEKKHQFCNGDCEATVEEVSLPALAQNSSWDEVERHLRDSELPYSIINKFDEHGKAIIHLICEAGKADLFQLLLKQPNFERDLTTTSGEYPLFLAATKPTLRMCRLLLEAGADPLKLVSPAHFDYEAFRKKPLRLLPDGKCLSFLKAKVDLKKKYPLYYIARVKSIDAAEAYKAAKQSAMHVAILNQLPVSIVQELVDEDMHIVNVVDENEESPLLVAARMGLADHVACLLANDADVDVMNKTGDTALIVASLAGHVDIVKQLLHGLADIDVENDDDKTVVMLLDEWLAANAPKGKGVTKKERMASPQAQIKALILEEDRERETSVSFREKLAQSLVDLNVVDAFDGNGFAKAINCSPVLGRTFLNDCLWMDRHAVHFRHMGHVYGEKVRSSALYAVLNMKTDDEDLIYEAKTECLEHVVMRRVIQIKWELFAQRKYLENLLVYGLLLVSMTISSILFDKAIVPATVEIVNPTGFATVVGVTSVVLTLTGFAMLQWLRPQALWRLARFGYDGSLSFDPTLKIDDLASYKVAAKKRLVIATAVLTVALSIVALGAILILGLEDYFIVFNNGVLAGAALYFVLAEGQEFKAAGLKYFADSTNCVQLFVYVLIAAFFVPMKLGIFGMVPLPVQIGFGGFLTIFLWLLSIQFLEVVPTASYLLPMIRNLMGDIWNFFMLLAVFQVGITITYYQIFVGKSDDAFGSLAQSFYTTYFILFGNTPTDSLASFTDLTEGGEHALYIFTVFLMMFHAAAVAIILMNLLMASMNKTVDGGLERAHTEALASYAQAILRLEQAMNYSTEENVKLMHLAPEVLNPIFTEPVPKARLSVTPEQEAMVTEHIDATASWQAKADTLRADVLAAYDAFYDGIVHVEHFTKVPVRTVLDKELFLAAATRAKLAGHFDDAAKCRGQQDRVALLTKYQRIVKKVIADLGKALHDIWSPDTEDATHARCVLVYQLAHQADLPDEVVRLDERIRHLFFAAVAEAEADKKDEPKASELMAQLTKVDEINGSTQSALDDMRAKVEELMAMMAAMKTQEA
ncbi:ankyrin 2,3/unc44 [Achlya hypogyna]|uniref:Ankyrin 2,3/unc44 n=1 Tax=Achlya hypogyna TaxID=1202772 RepID=A0A1V9YND1_ACHHY|nr:ankyrin 2,3/unc44 [Achlya hypogyna]